MKRILTAAAVFVGLAAVVQAQDRLTGKWQGQTRNGARLVLELAATDATLTGTFTRNEQTSPITEGRRTQNRVTFKVTLGDRTEGFTGEHVGNELTLWLDRIGRESAAILERVEAKE